MIDVLDKAFNKGKKILDILEQHQYKAYFVGGCVRDFLLHRTIGDIDIATSARPEDVQRIFSKVIPVGIEHGTVIVRFENESFEVTTFRLDGKYSDKRHPDYVEFVEDIEYDLKRRDFTINALAMDRHGEIIDPYGGKNDLEKQQIKTVGNGYKRFVEDPLRIVRALRFSSQLGFSIEKRTLSHMITVKAHIDHIAIERIANECEKLFASPFVEKGITYLIETKTYEHLPILKDHPDIVSKLKQMIQPLHSFGEVIALLHLLAPSVSIKTWTNAWKCSNRTRQEAIILTQAMQYYRKYTLDEWLIYNLKPTNFSSFIRLMDIFYPRVTIDKSQLIDIYQRLPIHKRQDMSINGHDIIQLFPDIKKGPWIEKLLQQLEKNIVLKKIPNDYHRLKEWIKCNPIEKN